MARLENEEEAEKKAEEEKNKYSEIVIPMEFQTEFERLNKISPGQVVY